MMTRILKLAIFLLLAGTAFGSAANIYLSSTGGTVNCGTAGTVATQTFAWASTAGNWGAGSGQIGQDTVVHRCAETNQVATTNVSLLTLHCEVVNGASGHPITFIADQGVAKDFTSGYWSGNGAIYGGSAQCSYIVLNGNSQWTVGNQNGSTPTNGTELANTQASEGIHFLNGCVHCTIEGFTIQNIYINSQSTPHSLGGRYTADIDIGSVEASAGGANATGTQILNNTLSSARVGINIANDSGNDASNLLLAGNTLSDNAWSITVAADNTSSTATNVIGHNNVMSNWINWEDTTPAETYHTDGYILYNDANGPIETFWLYNDQFTGTLGQFSATAYYTCGRRTSCTLFNSVLNDTGPYTNNGIIWLYTPTGPHQIYNNTIIGAAGQSNICVTLGDDAGLGGGTTSQLTFENNICEIDLYGLHDYRNLLTDTVASDYNVWTNTTGSGAPQMATNDGTAISYGTWTGTDGYDTHSATTNPNLDGSFHIQSTGSSAYHRGANLTSLCSGNLVPLCTDPLGSARPTGSAPWDAGAYQYQLQVAAPTFTCGGSDCTSGGTFANTVTITVATATGGASLFTCYTVNPTCTPGTAYSTPLTETGTGYLCADGTLSGYTPSVTVCAQFVITASFTITVTSPSNGIVSSSPSGISCPSTCSASFTAPVTLTAAPNSGYIYGTWGGLCSGSDATPCSGLTSTGTVSATFTAIVAPTVTTTTASSITSTSAQSGGTVTSNGGAPVTAQGVAYGTSPNPTSPCTGGGTSSPYTFALSPLTASTLYYYRACATNSVGTDYGSDLSFTTLANPQAAAPTFSPAAPYSSSSSFTVAISDTTPSPTITYCILPGTSPCSPSTSYSSAVTISATSQLCAYATAPVYTQSATTCGQYTVTAGPPSGGAIIGVPSAGGGAATIGYTPQNGAKLAASVDGNELVCKLPGETPCPANSPGILLAAPTYIMTIGTSAPPTWSCVTAGCSLPSGAPPVIPACNSYLSSILNTAAGLQSAANFTECYRTQSGGVTGFEIFYPVASADTGCDNILNRAYCGQVLVPQTNTVFATSPIIFRSAAHASLAALPEPVGNGGIGDNTASYPTVDDKGRTIYPALINDDLQGDNLQYQLGTTLYCAAGGTYPTCNSTGAITFANGRTSTAANYNYLQYMGQWEENTPNNNVISFCNPATGPCQNPGPASGPCAGLSLSPDHWEFDDMVISLPAGSQLAPFLIQTGSVGQTVYPCQFAQSIHFRKISLRGDFNTTLSTGANATAGGVNLGAVIYGSVEGSSAEGLLRPGLEGHIGSANGAGIRFENNYFRGMSSGIFMGGYSNPPLTANFVPSDVTMARTVFSWPQEWMNVINFPDINPTYGGASGAYTPVKGQLNIPCQQPSPPSTVTCVTIDSTGKVLTYSSGPFLHDSSSNWPNQNILINPTYSSKGVVTAGRYQMPKTSGWSAQCPPTCYPSTSYTITMGSAVTCYNASGGVISPCDGTTPQTVIVNSPSLTRKNPEEIKECIRCTFYGNIFEHSDLSGGQHGNCDVAGNRQVSGTGLFGANYLSAILDLNFVGNIGRICGVGDDMGSRSNSNPQDGGGSSYENIRIRHWNELLYGISGSLYGDGSNWGDFISSGAQTWGGNVSCNSATPPICTYTAVNESYTTTPYKLESDAVNFGSTCTTSLNKTTLTTTCTGVNNTFTAGTGTNVEAVIFMGPGLVDTPTGCFVGGQNVMEITAATSTSFTATLTGVSGGCTVTGSGFAQGPVGFQVFDMYQGDPVYITGCSASALNPTTNPNAWPYVASYYPTYTIPVQTGISGGVAYAPYLTAASPAWDPVNGWTPAMTTITFPGVASMAGASTTDGSCQLNNIIGSPQQVTLQHRTLITDGQNPEGGGSTSGKGGEIGMNDIFSDDIFVMTNPAAYNPGKGGWFNSNGNSAMGQEGNGTETFAYDPATLAVCNTVWPGRTNTLYQWYANNPIFPSTCSGKAGVAPSGYFPAGTCGVLFNGTGAWSATNCAATPSSNLVPLVASDYHQYSLSTSSPFHNAATDGLDVGAIISGTLSNGMSIDQAQTTTAPTCANFGPGVVCNGTIFPY